MVKPDGVKRGLVGEIIRRFENAGLKFMAMKLLWPERPLLEKHYPATPELLKRLGDNTVRAFTTLGRDLVKTYGTSDPIELGKRVRGWLLDYTGSGNVVAMVLEGNHAVKNVRRIVGTTIPTESPPGTIRGDYSIDSADAANTEDRPLQNLVHASGNAEEAKDEIKLWFPELKD